MPCRGPEPWELLPSERGPDLTALLCEAAHLIEDKSRMSKDLKAWWNKHEKEDRKRQALENEKNILKRLKSEALSKLTTEEVEALRHAGLSV